MQDDLEERMAVAINETMHGKAVDSDPRSIFMARLAIAAAGAPVAYRWRHTYWAPGEWKLCFRHPSEAPKFSRDIEYEPLYTGGPAVP